MSEPLSDDERLTAMIAERITDAHLTKYEGSVCGDCFLYVDHLAAEVRRLREENAKRGSNVTIRFTEIQVERDAEVSLRQATERAMTKFAEERDAARADLARAILLLRCITETPTPIPGVTLGDYHEHVAAFLAEMEKR